MRGGFKRRPMRKVPVRPIPGGPILARRLPPTGFPPEPVPNSSSPLLPVHLDAVPDAAPSARSRRSVPASRERLLTAGAMPEEASSEAVPTLSFHVSQQSVSRVARRVRAAASCPPRRAYWCRARASASPIPPQSVAGDPAHRRSALNLGQLLWPSPCARRGHPLRYVRWLRSPIRSREHPRGESGWARVPPADA
jgi:hypothetical protein